MRIGLRFWAFPFLLSSAFGASQVYYLPQVIDGAASTGSLTTTILLSNLDATTANVQITLSGDDGSPHPLSFPALGAGSQFSLTLAPGGTEILQSDGSGDGTAAAASISSSATLGVSVIVSAYDSNGNLLSESGAASADANSAYVIPVDTTGGLNTGIALFNPNNTTANLTFTLFARNGAQAGSGSAILAGGGHLSRMTTGGLFPGITNFQGTMAVTSSAPVAAAGFRQNSAALSYTLLDATPTTSLGLNFYLPQVADGPGATATLQTAFLLYNLSANSATVTVALSQSGGAPWIVNIPGLGASNSFQVTLAPAGSAILETDGQGASTTGAAAIRSTQPLGVAAVVTASGSAGNFLSETAVSPAPAQEKFLLPFDTTNTVNSGLALFNPGSLPVTLKISQLDSSGNALGSAQSDPIAPGAQMAAYVSDFFPDAPGIQGALAVAVTGAVGASVAVTALRQNMTPLAMAATPAGPLPVTGTGINITPTLDPKSAATAAITPAGGSLSLTDAKGNQFTLTIPANALLSTTTVTMTPVTAISGLPAGGTFNAGVQLEPDGLELFQRALLAITLAGAPPAGTVIPLGWHGAGQGLYLNLVEPQSNTLTLALDHFSGAGVGSGSDSYLTTQLLNIGNVLDLDTSRIAYWNNLGREQELTGQSAASTAQMASSVFEEAYQDIQNFMQLALQTQDDDTLRCAIQSAVQYQRARETSVGGQPDDPVGMAISGFVQQAIGIYEQRQAGLCQKTHDPLAGFNLVANSLVNSVIGYRVETFLPLVSLVNQCSPTPSLDFQSEISGSGAPAASNTTGSIKADSKLSAQLTLTGAISQDSFSGGGSGYTAFMLNGSGPLSYQSFSLSGMAIASAGPSQITCTYSAGATSGSTLTVEPQSQIQYQFMSKYDPNATLSPALTGGKAKSLAQFCPVYAATPVSVSLVVDPGSPEDNILSACSPGGTGGSAPSNIWTNLWSADHGAAGSATITGWQIPGSSSFAHKEFDQSISTGFPGISSFSGMEKTTLDLNQPQ